MAGVLYQLASPYELRVGSYVGVNGPYDSHGVVIKSEHRPDKNDWLNLIRGVPSRKGEGTVFEF